MSDQKFTAEQFEDTAEAMESAGEKMTARMLRQAAQDQREREVGGAVAEVYEHPNYNYGPVPRMRTEIRFTGAPLPAGTKLYTARRAAVPDDRLQKAIGALLWINEEVWPLVHGLTCRETLKKRFLQLPDLIEYLAAASKVPNVSPE